MEKEGDTMLAFDMGSLSTNLPSSGGRRGLSRYYSGKARSFACIMEVHTVEDLKKKKKDKLPDGKKIRKKYPENVMISTFPCRRVSSTTQCSTPYIGL